MIIINGASRGIGKFLFESYFGKNEQVIGTYNSTKPKDNLDFFENLDVTNQNSVSTFVKKITPKLNDITLINCAGITYNSYAHKAEIDKWTKVIDVNLIGVFRLIHSILPIMREQGFGRIINFSSVVAQRGTPGASAYASSKSALWGLARSLAVENASKGITINSLNLGYFDIGMIEEVPEDYRSTIIETIPNKRFGHPSEILNSIEYLRNNSYVNGTSININAALYD
ncbi:MAG: SDR family NAD(P)-dependent oxidoreductase [Leptospira sp.]|nr:SDR family NAD(P)-dependent oxidoreductase [Leptospira sp.]